MNNPKFTTGDRVRVDAPDGSYHRHDGKQGVVTDCEPSCDKSHGGLIDVLLEDGERISLFGYRLNPITDDWTVYRYQDVVNSAATLGTLGAKGAKVAGPYSKHAAWQAATVFDLPAGTYQIVTVSPDNNLSVREIKVETARTVMVST